MEHIIREGDRPLLLYLRIDLAEQLRIWLDFTTSGVPNALKAK